MARKRYLFFDIDGTLLIHEHGRGYIPDSTKRAIEKLRTAGHFLCIATGRAHILAVPYMQQLGFENMVSDGGYGITLGGELLGIKPLPRENVIRLIDECREKGLAWGIQPDDREYRLVPDEQFELRSHDTYMKSHIRPGLEPRDFENLYKAYIAGNEEQIASLESLKELPWYRFMPDYIFVEPTDKAYGIRKVMDRLGADYGDVIVFGDSINDMAMFTDEWTCVAMGNAIPELKARADLVTTAVDDDGIYNACEALGLFEPVTEA